MRFIYTICRYFVGVLFIFSGGIKINDPVGTQIKLQEYFEVFSLTSHQYLKFLFLTH